jgi:HlyD family secretion protein
MIRANTSDKARTFPLTLSPCHLVTLSPCHSPWLTFGLAAALLGAVGCGGNSKGSPAPGTDSAVPASAAVRVVTPERKTITRTIRQPGAIQAFEQTPIFAKIPGYVKEFHVDIGDIVQKGSLLAELWVPEMVSELKLKKEQVQQATKALATAQAQVATAQAQVQEAEAGLSRAEANHNYWKGQSARFTELVKDSVLDRQTQEETLNKYQAAAAALTEARARIASAKALQQEKERARDKAEVDIRAAEADRQRQADLVGYARLLAPYDGVVTRRNINTSDFVQAPTGGKGEPLYVVERRDIMRIFVEVPETDAVWVRKGAEAHVRVQALQGREFTGKVDRTSYALDRTTRTLLTEIDLPNPQDQLRPGMYAYASITIQHRDVLTLPLSAIVTEGDVNVGYQTFCCIVEDGRIKRTQIEVGARNDQLVEVLKKRVPEARPGDGPRWEDFNGTEQVAARATGLSDGQAIEVDASGK